MNEHIVDILVGLSVPTTDGFVEWVSLFFLIF